MGNHQTTATTDVKSQDYKKVESHNERETDNHSNKDIDVTKSYLNTHEELLDYDALKKQHYADHVEKVNKNRRGAPGKENSKYENVDDYLKRTKGSADTTFVQWFGNKEDWAIIKDDLITQGLTEEEIVSALDAGYREYANEFNERHEYIKIQKWSSHHDEHTPHYQGRMFTMGTTKAGNPSKTLNSALEQELPHVKTGNRDRLSAWRSREDRAFFEQLAGSLSNVAKTKGIDVQIELYRKNEHNGLTMSGYKEMQRIKDYEQERLCELSKVADTIKEKENELSEREISLKRKEQDVDKRSGNLDIREIELQEKEDVLQSDMEKRLREEREKDEKEKAEYKQKVLTHYKKLAEKAKRMHRKGVELYQETQKRHKEILDKHKGMVDVIEGLPLSGTVKNKAMAEFMGSTEDLIVDNNEHIKKVNNIVEERENDGPDL